MPRSRHSREIDFTAAPPPRWRRTNRPFVPRRRRSPPCHTLRAASAPHPFLPAGPRPLRRPHPRDDGAGRGTPESRRGVYAHFVCRPPLIAIVLTSDARAIVDYNVIITRASSTPVRADFSRASNARAGPTVRFGVLRVDRRGKSYSTQYRCASWTGRPVRPRLLPSPPRRYIILNRFHCVSLPFIYFCAFCKKKKKLFADLTIYEKIKDR